MNTELYTLHNVSNYIIELLRQEMNEVIWEEKTLGAVFPKELTGFIYCDSLEFLDIGKSNMKAKAVYGIDIICPNPKMQTRPIEQLALKTRKILTSDFTLGNWALTSSVERIVFGTPAGMNTIGRALLLYTVYFEMED